MADSLVTSLLNMLDQRTVGEVAGALGQSGQSVSRGMGSSIASLLAGLASKAEDPGALQRIFDMAPATGGVSWSKVASGISDPNSSLMATGRRVLSALFGSKEAAVTNGISRESGLGAGATSTLMSMAVPVVLGFVGKRMRDEGMNWSSLGSLLQRESGAIRSALPAGLSELFWPGATMAAGAASPVVAQTVKRESSFPSWLAALAIAALGLGLFWLLMHPRRPAEQAARYAPTGEASRVATPVPTCVLPGNVTVNIPPGGSEARLLAFLQNSNAKPDATWFELERLTFRTGSATLRPGAQEQIDNLAAILTACPNVHLMIGGQSDSTGGAAQNLQLSQSRANNVRAELISKGVSPDCLSAEGYGDQFPVGDNSTEEGRAQNRRVALRVMQK